MSRPVTLAGMLTMSAELRDAIVAHARADHPDEACGVIAGPAGSGRPQRLIPMLNAERSPTFYRFDSLEQLRVWRKMCASTAPGCARKHKSASAIYTRRWKLRER